MLTGLGNWSPAWKLVERDVLEAEKAGFWGVVFPDQYMWNPSELGVDSYAGVDSTLETWVTLTALAAKTDTVMLGTWVTPIPLRPPGILAKMVTTLDVISAGRSILGVGAGSCQKLFDGYGKWDTPRSRVDRTREGVELIVKLWTQKKVDYKGRFYNAKGAVLEPKPVQKPHPPLLFGGSGPRMLRLAGKYADICYIPPWGKMSQEEARELVRSEAKRNERSLAFADAYTPLGPDQAYNRRDYGKKVEEASRNGLEYFITAFSMDVPPWEITDSSLHETTESYLKCLTDFANNIIPSYNE